MYIRNEANLPMSEGEKQRGDISIGSWMLTLLLMAIPVINLVPLLCWAIGSKKPSRRNYAIACLIWMLICVVAIALCLVLFHAQILTWLKAMVDTKP